MEELGGHVKPLADMNLLSCYVALYDIHVIEKIDVVSLRKKIEMDNAPICAWHGSRSHESHDVLKSIDLAFGSGTSYVVGDMYSLVPFSKSYTQARSV